MVRRRLLPTLATLTLCVGCPASEDSRPMPKPVSTTDGGPAPESVVKKDPLPKVPAMDGTEPLPAVKVLAEAKACPPLALLAKDAPQSQRKLVPAIEVLRAISCRPEVFGQALAKVVKTLPVPEGVELELRRRAASVKFSEPVLVRDLLAAMGVAKAKMRLRQGWASFWVVGSGDDAGVLQPWGPGEITIRIEGERNDEKKPGTLADVPDDAVVDGSVAVAMPESALSFAADPHAAPALAAALVELAKDPRLLDREPEKLRKTLATLGERYDAFRYSEGMGDQERRGFSLRTRRTELVAAELAKALGFKAAAHERRRITDANPNRLAEAGQAKVVWHGLQLEIELTKRKALGLGLQGWIVNDVQVLPGPKD